MEVHSLIKYKECDSSSESQPLLRWLWNYCKTLRVVPVNKMRFLLNESEGFFWSWSTLDSEFYEPLTNCWPYKWKRHQHTSEKNHESEMIVTPYVDFVYDLLSLEKIDKKNDKAAQETQLSLWIKKTLQAFRGDTDTKIGKVVRGTKIHKKTWFSTYLYDYIVLKLTSYFFNTGNAEYCFHAGS